MADVTRVEVTEDDPDISQNLDSEQMAEIEAERRDHAAYNPSQQQEEMVVAAASTTTTAPTTTVTEEPRVVSTPPTTQEAESETPKDFQDLSNEAIIALFDQELGEDPAQAVADMRERLDKALEGGLVSDKYHALFSEVLDEVESAPDDQKAQVFKEALEDNPELKKETANLLLLREASEKQANLLELGGGIGILFAMLDMISGGDTDFMGMLENILDEIGVEIPKPEEEQQQVAKAETEEPAVGAEEENPGQEQTEEQEQVAQVDVSTITEMDFSGSDSELQTDDPTLRNNALSAMNEINVSTAGIAGSGAPDVIQQYDATVSYEIPSVS